MTPGWIVFRVSHVAFGATVSTGSGTSKKSFIYIKNLVADVVFVGSLLVTCDYILIVDYQRRLTPTLSEELTHNTTRHDMSEDKDIETVKKGAFFAVPLNAIYHMINIHRERDSELVLEAEEILAYICLCRGAGRFTSSGWTEHAIATYCNMTQGRATKACTYLVQNGLINLNENYRAVKSDQTPVLTSGAVGNEDGGSDNEPRNKRHKYFLNCRNEEKMIYFPNCIVDGAISGRKLYPLSTLSKGSFLCQPKGITSREARLDAVILLMVLYAHHDLQKSGGVDLGLWSTWFTPVESGDGLGTSPPTSELCDTGYSIHEVERGSEYFQTSLIAQFFSYISDENIRNNRINSALKSLLKLRFIYEVLQVWTGSTQRDDEEIELEYPLYICDSSQRASGEPSLAKQINSLAFLLYDRAIVFPRDETFNIGDGNQFRFICDDERRGYLISSLRMKYRPHDHDCGVGMKEQSAMVSNWTEMLANIKEECFS
jgi:hypothetical protein